jgi:hypothetical protein
MIFNCCVICTANPAKGYQYFALLYLFTCLSQGLTFLFLQSDACQNNPIVNLGLPVDPIDAGAVCKLLWGANVGIAATVLWFVCACLMCCIGFKESKGTSEESHDAEDQAMEEAEKEHPGDVNDPATE